MLSLLIILCLDKVSRMGQITTLQFYSRSLMTLLHLEVPFDFQILNATNEPFVSYFILKMLKCFDTEHS